jgi:hypothetical protein
MNCLLGRKARGLILILAVLFCYALVPTPSYAADIDVYAEGAYTATDMVLYIYADIHVDHLLSFGVKVNYPSGLTYSSATKNDAIWEFRDGATVYPYMNPENVNPSGGDPGEVVIIGGKLDTATPKAGVTGTRVLLGTVTFAHSGVTDFSGVTLTYGRDDGAGGYENFVGMNAAQTAAVEYDGSGVDFTEITIAMRGDANLDDRINTQDMSVIRNTIVTGGIIHPWMDCNNDGRINTQDMSCVRNIITSH